MTQSVISRVAFSLTLIFASSSTAKGQDVLPVQPLTVGIIGDQTYAPDLDAAYRVLEQGVAVVSRASPRLVLHVGDLLESSQTVDEIRAQFAWGTAILDRLPAPWYMTAGDHDVNPPGFLPDSSDRSREALFQELYGARVPAVREHPYYSFDVEGYHFVALYSHEALHADPRWGDIFLAQISDAQLAWLKQDLESRKAAKAVVVFIHQPLWYHWSGWQRVHDVLKRYPVVAVVSGHFHYDQNGGVVDGIRYLTVGATGGSVKTGGRDAGAVQHVSVMTVRPKGVEIRLLPVSDTLPLAITPRLDMDRTQALDIVLGELWNFGATNPVYLKDGALVDSCVNGQPARIRLVPIGNPIDLPVEVSIAFDPGAAAVALAGPEFVPGQCQTVVSDSECVVARGKRVWSSNYSSVQVDPYAGPIWESGLTLTGAPPPAGTPLSFDVRLAFTGAGGELFLERRATTTIAACP